MGVTCVQIYGLMFRILTRFIRFTLARRVFIAILLFDIGLFWHAFHIDRKSGMRRISWYSYLLETLISSEYGLTISGPVTVLRQWPLEKNTDYIIK